MKKTITKNDGTVVVYEGTVAEIMQLESTVTPTAPNGYYPFPWNVNPGLTPIPRVEGWTTTRLDRNPSFGYNYDIRDCGVVASSGCGGPPGTTLADLK